MISRDGIGAKRWVVPPEATETSGSLPSRLPPGVEFEFDGSGAAMANEGMDHLKAAACAFSGSLSQVIRQNPYRAVLVASGMGILAGILLKRPGSARRA